MINREIEEDYKVPEENSAQAVWTRSSNIKFANIFEYAFLIWARLLQHCDEKELSCLGEPRPERASSSVDHEEF